MQSIEVSTEKMAKILPPERAIATSRWSGLVNHLQQWQKMLGEKGCQLTRQAVYEVLGAMSIGYLKVTDGKAVFETARHSDASIQAHIDVLDSRAYGCIASNGVLGAAEAYMRGYWTTPDLVAVVRFMVANMQALQLFNERQGLVARLLSGLVRQLNRNSLSGSRDNIASHYDLGNDFFALFLDPTMMYSSALFENRDIPLEKASIAKLDRICRNLELTPGDHLLEIGSGWGGMAIYAAKNYGCRVTTTTISKEQYDFVCDQVAANGLQDQITVLCRDYRELEGQFDKLVSIEMIEAVGYEYYSTYFSQCSRLLADDGLMMIQAITIPDQRFDRARRSVDFIKRYIFPGGCLPSLSVIAEQVASQTDMNILDIKDMTQDYATTLFCWRQAFNRALPEVRRMGFDTYFIRMWEYYLCYCEGGFAERVIGTSQILMAKPDYRCIG